MSISASIFNTIIDFCKDNSLSQQKAVELLYSLYDDLGWIDQESYENGSVTINMQKDVSEIWDINNLTTRSSRGKGRRGLAQPFGKYWKAFKMSI